MAKFVTRTINVHEVTFNLFDKENKEIVTRTEKGFSGLNDQQIEKELEKAYKHSDFFKFLSIESIVTTEKHYKMLESQFIDMAIEF